LYVLWLSCISILNLSKMKKILFSTICLLLLVTSCRKDNLKVSAPVVAQTDDIVDQTWLRYPIDTIPAIAPQWAGKVLESVLSHPETSLVPVPDVNVYQAAPTTAVKYNNVSYYGGPFQSTVSYTSGSSVTFLVKRTDGLKFPINSVINITTTNAGGIVLASGKITNGTSTVVSVSVADNNKWNVNNTTETNHANTNDFVLTWYNPVSGYTFYTNPIKIVAVPVGWGVNLGNLQGVPVFSNGWGGFAGTDYLWDAAYNNAHKYQCVHFIQRYYQTIKGRNIGNADAGEYWDRYTTHKLTQRINNGGGVPVQGDIICFTNQTSGARHVGIVNGVSATGLIRIFEENIGTHLRTETNNYCAAYQDFSYTKNASGGYVINAAVLGTGWVTNGWVR
jgi:hypothetical protein